VSFFRNQVYYAIKPLLPWKLRTALRGWHARRISKMAGPVWPIKEMAGRPPDGWNGWPDGKKFALVLTHDVEGPRGLERVPFLAELEMQLGFRSCFNFIPEGDYAVPDDLREWLAQNQFEVGVHDLHHDGRLYSSKSAFRNNARRINRYLKQWNAVGFRSGFMLHNLDWLHHLEIAYDSSTFDTDPFEPQPDDVNTAFPFWVGRSEGGYVELPYTLPQDFTLFVLLRERDIAVWLRKLDWIVRHGAMALLNTHPDYMTFDRGAHGETGYPASFYGRFLEYLRERHSHEFWHALPREIAVHARPGLLSQPCSK
jgi:hypothetical protein